MPASSNLVDCPAGTLLLTSDEGELTGCSWTSDIAFPSNLKTDILRTAKKELLEYFKGTLHQFSIHIRLTGNEFNMKVWRAIMQIPYGETASYKDIAQEIGSPKAYRAVGHACGKNPIAIIIPCHRVVGISNPYSYTGPRGAKQLLLSLEQRNKKNFGNKIW